jgi:chromosome segregation ATPase
MDAENSGQFESGWDIQAIQMILKSVSVNLHSQQAQLSLKHQNEVIDLRKNPSQNVLNKETSEKRKIINENSNLNTELNRTYTIIHDLQKSVSTTKAEIESLMAVITELEREKLEIKTTIQSLEDEVKQSSNYNDQLSRSLQIQPTESELLQSHRDQLDKLTKTITLHLKDKGNIEKCLLQQKEQTESIEEILHQTLDIRKQLYPKEPPPILMVKNSSRENDCIICQEREKVIALVPCGHKCICESCSERISLCPICNTQSSGKFRIYL